MPIASVVADANVQLSAVVGKAALRVFTKFTVRVHVTQFNADEVAEYLLYMARKYELPLELVEMQWKLLPLRIHLTRLLKNLMGVSWFGWLVLLWSDTGGIETNCE